MCSIYTKGMASKKPLPEKLKNQWSSQIDVYTQSAQLTSRAITQSFSTSFSSAIRLFGKPIQQDIHNIYALVRVADEVVDTYKGADALKILNDLEHEVYATLQRNFSANIVVHAFCRTAQSYNIDEQLIEPFFASMRMDISKKRFNASEYKRYIYGSAEVVGLMCLKVFVKANSSEYENLKEGAMALGAAFQKVNFLRDIKDDYETRGRYYFPIGSFEKFSDTEKEEVIRDIQRDFKAAQVAIKMMPKAARSATQLAYEYYSKLLEQLAEMSAVDILQRRASVGTFAKTKLQIKTKLLRHAS